jgi:hypothetical protein
MQPDRVEQLVARLCEEEGPLLSHIYGCAGALAESAAKAAGGAALVRGGKGGAADARQLVKVFFLHALAVPPNK